MNSASVVIDVPVDGQDVSDVLGRFFKEFLDESSFSEFRSVERLIRSLKDQGQTVSGYPIIRPSDCGRILSALEGLFVTAEGRFRTHDLVVTERFENLISDFSLFCSKVYPSESLGVQILHARVKLFMGDAQGALDLVAHHAKRPYLVEGGVDAAFSAIEVYAQALVQLARIGEANISFIALGRWLATMDRKDFVRSAVKRIAIYVPLALKLPEEGVLEGLIRWASIRYQAALNGRRKHLRGVLTWIYAGFFALVMTNSYRFMARSGRGRNPFKLSMNKRGGTLVTRAMGGIGDLLMMEPGLEALAAKQKGKVDFALPRKFHPIFSNNPHVNLIDIDGPEIDISQYRRWVNLSDCPAGRYESRHRPRVKKGRVEIFARAMGINRRRLRQQGWRINSYLTDVDEAFCDQFFTANGIGSRPVIGIQPYSRDSYKDHIYIREIMAGIAEHYDVIVFHHVANGLPTGKGIATTAGLPLGQSLALVSRLNAMVSVDSAFLHAAAAFDVPVVALFGPTDGQTFTRHHAKVKLLWKPESFGCVPCWRNEDIPCAVTGLRSASPCISSISKAEVIDALHDMVGSGAIGR